MTTVIKVNTPVTKRGLPIVPNREIPNTPVRCNPITPEPCVPVGKVAQTDWRETDKNSPAYLKNRPESVVESVGGLKAGIDGDIPIADLQEHIANQVTNDIKDINEKANDLTERVVQLENYHDDEQVTKEQLLIAWDFL